MDFVQVRISVLKEEKRLLALQLKAASSQSTTSTTTTTTTKTSNVSQETKSQEGGIKSTATAQLAETPKSPKTPPPTLPKPAKVRTVGVGEHSVVEPYNVQPELPTGYTITHNEVSMSSVC